MAHRVIDPAQIRAARALLDISQGDLAELSGVGIATIKRLESAPDVLRVTAGVLMRVQMALEQAGVEFIFEDETRGSGVRRRSRSDPSMPMNAQAPTKPKRLGPRSSR